LFAGPTRGTFQDRALHYTQGMSWSEPAIITSIILIVITFIYVVLTGLIWWATWQNTRATRQVLEANARPYVGITKIDVKWEGQERAVLVATIKNVGSALTGKVVVDLRCTLVPAAQDAPEISVESIALLPSASFEIACPFIGPMVSWFQPTTELRVDITVQYRSMIGKEYSTRGRYQYRGPMGFAVEFAEMK
jgi:hypothetical protein